MELRAIRDNIYFSIAVMIIGGWTLNLELRTSVPNEAIEADARHPRPHINVDLNNALGLEGEA